MVHAITNDRALICPCLAFTFGLIEQNFCYRKHVQTVSTTLPTHY